MKTRSKASHSNGQWWRHRIPWYPDGCFGPYRSAAVGYSRRELIMDGIVHAYGVALGLIGLGAMLTVMAVREPPAEVALSLCLYSWSLLAMLVCSATFNALATSQHIWLLQLADHTGILLLIAGTCTPMYVMACCPRALSFVWTLALISFSAKASRSRLDVVALHVPCFLLMGWSALAVWPQITAAFTTWAKNMCVAGGALYTIGLVPWAANGIEGHNALWHAFVLAASGCFFAVHVLETAQPGSWLEIGGVDVRGSCLMK